MTRRMFALGWLFVASACARRADPSAAERNAPAAEPTCACEATQNQPVDTTLMAWLSKARTLHHLADLAESQDTPDKAIVLLEELANGALPPGPPPEAAEVLADTYARLGELRARGGEFERADHDVIAGLAYAQDKTYFRGHLLEVQGLIYQRLSQHLAQTGRPGEAKLAREKAMQASLEAVSVQDEVIKSALGDAGRKSRD